MINQGAIDLLERAIEVIRKFNGDSEIPTPPEPSPVGPKHHTIRVPKFTGKEKSTKWGKLNPQFVMKGGMFGYPKNGPSNRYAYNTKYLNKGKSFLWYFPKLTGEYRCEWHFRATRNRSKRRPDIRLVRDGVVIDSLVGPVQYRAKSAYDSFVFFFTFREQDFIEIRPADPKSIAFGRMEFTRID